MAAATASSICVALGDVERQDEGPVIEALRDISDPGRIARGDDGPPATGSTSFASSRPKPVEQPVISQTGQSRFIIQMTPL